MAIASSNTSSHTTVATLRTYPWLGEGLGGQDRHRHTHVSPAVLQSSGLFSFGRQAAIAALLSQASV
jgi:hypothetical protein